MITARDIDLVVARIVALYAPDEIHLFGSHARGNATDRSDLDLVIVRPSELPRGVRGRDVAAVLSSGMAFRMDLLFVTPEELARERYDPDSVLCRVMPHARSIYRRVGSDDDRAAS